MKELYQERTYTLPALGENGYGYKWPEGTDQIVRELAGFKYNGSRPGFLSRYEHGLNLIRLIWPEDVNLFVRYKDCRSGAEVVIWNNFFMDTFKALCENRRVGLTGASSTGKTFCVAVYALLMFFSNPEGTTVAISTTAGTDAERRVWGELKSLHRAAMPAWNMGTLIDYLHVITFDPGRELKGKTDVKERDIRNGIIVIPIPKGAEGQNALGKVIGSKNKRFIWVIDEAPNMIEEILRPVSNLESNIWFQLVLIGNANKKSDPHGRFCEPTHGWESIEQDIDEHWLSGRSFILFLHGAKSPNFHPAVSRQLTDAEADKEKLPFPYLSNRIFLESIAYENGSTGLNDEDRVREGQNTIDYMRFGVGFWYGDDVAATILSRQFIREHGADVKQVDWSHRRLTAIAGFDPGWSSGGDASALMFSQFGFDIHDKQILCVEPECVNVKAKSSDRESFRKQIAADVIVECSKRGVEPQDLFMDISGDGGLMALEIQQQWSEKLGSAVKITGLSSLESTDDSDRYHDRVTQFWYQCARAVGTGRVRGFNLNSGYSKDLCSRFYESVGKGVVRVESKKSMKKRINRSPDEGDSFAYMTEGAKRRGFQFESSAPPKKEIRRIPGYFPNQEAAEEFVTFEEAEGEYSFS